VQCVTVLCSSAYQRNMESGVEKWSAVSDNVTVEGLVGQSVVL